MRRPWLVPAALLLVSGVGLTGGPAAPASALTKQPAVTAVVATGVVNSPGGIALDAAGDLFVADTDHCRVVVLPHGAGSMYGLRVKAGHVYDVAGSSCGGHGGHDALGYPTGVAVDQHGDVFIAEAAEQRVQVVRPGGRGGPHPAITVAGTGLAGYDGSGLLATKSTLNQPTGVAVDAAGDLFIADTANCRVRVLPAASGTQFGQAMTVGHLYDVAGNGVCGSGDRSGPAGLAQLANPVAVALDRAGDLFVADQGDQSVLEAPVHGGFYYGTVIGGGDIATIVGGNGHGPYLEDGLPAASVAAEMNDPEGLAVGSDGTLYITDGAMHCIRVVPDATRSLFGRAMKGGSLYTLAGALPISTSSGAGNGTRWVLTHLGVPTGIAVAPSGDVIFSDRGLSQVREIG
jgi:sugar lactone lactonase YvrE